MIWGSLLARHKHRVSFTEQPTTRRGHSALPHPPNPPPPPLSTLAGVAGVRVARAGVTRAAGQERLIAVEQRALSDREVRERYYDVARREDCLSLS